ncbi:MAG: hypothetical protein E7508_08595 [Ruminococcus sp.]|nr:hypothetical protein [Ruminococcus sp.]
MKNFPKKKITSFLCALSAAAVLPNALNCSFSSSDTVSAFSYYGDANSDSNINEEDVIILQQYLTKQISEIPDFYACDMDDDLDVDIFDLIFPKRLLLYNVYPGESPSQTQPAVTTTPATTTTTVATTVSQADTAKVYAEEVLKIVNAKREAVGAEPLTLNSKMCSAAMVRAQEITELFSHTRPDGQSWSSIYSEFGITYYNAGENIAAGSSTPQGVMNQWVNSSGHYANIINSDFTELGVGYVYAPNSPYGYYWVQLFR